MRVGDIAAKNVACVAEIKKNAPLDSLSKTRVFEKVCRNEKAGEKVA